MLLLTLSLPRNVKKINVLFPVFLYYFSNSVGCFQFNSMFCSFTVTLSFLKSFFLLKPHSFKETSLYDHHCRLHQPDYKLSLFTQKTLTLYVDLEYGEKILSDRSLKHYNIQHFLMSSSFAVWCLHAAVWWCVCAAFLSMWCCPGVSMVVWCLHDAEYLGGEHNPEAMSLLLHPLLTESLPRGFLCDLINHTCQNQHTFIKVRPHSTTHTHHTRHTHEGVQPTTTDGTQLGTCFVIYCCLRINLMGGQCQENKSACMYGLSLGACLEAFGTCCMCVSFTCNCKKFSQTIAHLILILKPLN